MHFARVYYSKSGSLTNVRGRGSVFSPPASRWRCSAGERNGERRVPLECIELDPAKLRQASSNGTIYRYEGEDPHVSVDWGELFGLSVSPSS